MQTATFLLIGALVASCASATPDLSPSPAPSPTLDAARTSIPDPGLPQVLLLLTPSGTPAPIDRVCMEITSARRVMDTDEAARMTSRALELLGIDVVDDGCRAILNVTATGSRTSARYSVGWCWTGWSYRITSALTVDGIAQASWSEEDEEPPPQTIRVDQCRPEGALVLDGNHIHTYLTTPFQEMWGNLGFFAIEAARDTYRIPKGLELSDELLQLIASRLLAEPVTTDFYEELPLWYVLSNWADTASGFEPDSRIATLRPLTPYLITLLERENAALLSDSARDGAAYVRISVTLQHITGQFVGSEQLALPADWWAWWNSQ